jgi:hypothetical protein
VVAKQVVDELMHRGVVILEIDSGAKPQPPGAIARYMSGLLEPISALENAGYAHAASDVGSHIDEIESLLPFRRARQLRWRIERLINPRWRDGRTGRQGQLPNVERITVVCNHDENVMTAWALGTKRGCFCGSRQEAPRCTTSGRIISRGTIASEKRSPRLRPA